MSYFVVLYQRQAICYETDSGSGHRLPKMRETQKNALTAVAELGIKATVESVSDINAIISFDVMMTPALVIDGNVKVVGKVPTPEDIKRLLT